MVELGYKIFFGGIALAAILFALYLLYMLALFSVYAVVMWWAETLARWKASRRKTWWVVAALALVIEMVVVGHYALGI